MTQAPWRDPSRSLDERVESLLAELSTEEKVAQLGSFWERPADPDAEGDVAPMQSAFDEGRRTLAEAASNGLGHLTRPYGSAPVDPVQGAQLLRAAQEFVADNNRLGIPAIAHDECLTGFTMLGATCYPAAIAWGASFEPALVHEMARRIGADMHALGVHQGLSPVLDVVRDYRWGRVEETMGEDPYVVGTLGTAYVQGLQESGVIATLKHFAGYSASRAGRNHAPVSIGRRELEDVILVPFEMAVRLGRAGSVMNSYSDVDGEPPAASYRMLTEILRDRWGFDGTVVSDYWAVTFLDTMHRVAASHADAGEQALAAGLDVELPETSCFTDLADAVLAGRVDPEVLDTAVRRVLRQKVQLGLVDDGWSPAPDAQASAAIEVDSDDNRAHARRMAERSIVLVRNESGLLPLGSSARRIGLIGPSAVQPRTYLGCYTFPNHVLSRYAEHGAGIALQTVLDALREELPEAEVEHAGGVDFTDPDTSGIAEALDLVTRSDLVVLTVGDLAGLFGRGTSGEGCDVVDLALPGAQPQLVSAVLDAAAERGVPVVLVLITGRPYAVGEYVDRCSAIVQAFMPGEEGGAAIAGVLSGRVNPSGKLPVGLPALRGGQPGTYLGPLLATANDGVSNLDPRPAFAFGHGLSYTTFDVVDLTLSSDTIAADGELEVGVTVRNTGDRPGAEVVQLYLSDPVAQVVRPVRLLAGFAKVDLEPDTEARVTFHLHADRLSFTGRDGRRVVEPGDVDVAVGTSSDDLPLVESFRVEGPLRVVPEGRQLDTPVAVSEAKSMMRVRN
ncbi:glycosyl hydrolase [Flexivirga sp. ID2601S]|uniref:Exo-alpha-(1->6)-L-arabinopyranosidase n=1 Tax=Flexivirga aerilata TaxID=1656889 RepID=A0A849AVA8_9MICO|nr:glycoside hydrolase family 3 N-terminal domain-containing protein [Flexivirga aerilata]NNG40612.1 glycosyl hydrolase [Flexivirga aerilata]